MKYYIIRMFFYILEIIYSKLINWYYNNPLVNYFDINKFEKFFVEKNY